MHFDGGLKDRNGERYMLPQRIDMLCDTLKKEYVYFDSQALNDLEIRQGADGEWLPFDGENERWGGRDTHFFFRKQVVVPARMAGCQVRLAVTPGPSGGWFWGAPQVLAYVDGRARQGMDSNHRELLLIDCARGGEVFDILLDAYCDMFYYTDPLQMRISLVCVDAEAEALYYDMLVPLETAKELSVDDERRVDIIAALNEACNRLDLRAPRGEDSIASVRAARAIVENRLYEGLCGRQPVRVTATGHTHIDVAWKWTYAQTRDKCARSFATALRMMEKYPEYRFMSSTPQLYAFLKQDHPDLFEQVKARVREGRWEVEGGMWVEADTNLTGGESLVRQILYGKLFFKREFDRDCRVLWLPDVFGYSAALPQIMKKSGLDYFMTTKISWNEYDKIPYDTFAWRGIDGSEVLSHFICARENNLPDTEYLTTYNASLNPSMVMGAWRRYQQKDLNRDILICYGHGDGGGGPEPDMQEQGARMARGIPGCPEVRYGTVRGFFERLEKDVRGNQRLPKWVGELYFEYHRGTYSSMAVIKRLNRQAEYGLQRLESACVLADTLTGCREYPRDMLHRCWETVLLNQFHDVLPGSSIKEVYEEVEKMQRDVLQKADGALKRALARVDAALDAHGDGALIFNPLPFDRTDAVLLSGVSDGVCAVTDENGVSHALQRLPDGAALCTAFAPSRGAAHVYFDDAAASAPPSCLRVDERGMENEFLSVAFDEQMHVSSLVVKSTGREIVPDGAAFNRLTAFEDRAPVDQAWNIQPYFEEHAWQADDVSSVDILESGPVRCALRVTRRFRQSVILQDYILYADRPRVDVRCHIDWKERDLLLKADFPTDINSDTATFDIQFGNLQRSTHRNTSWDFAQFEVCAHKWVDLSQDDYGVAVLNDCKYGCDVKDGRIRLTLLKSSCYPNPAADKCAHEFTYAIYPHEDGWRKADVDAEAFRLNCPMVSIPCKGHIASGNAQAMLASTDRNDVVIDTVKYAEDGDDIILRLYENMNRGGAFKLTLGFDADGAHLCNLMEEDIVPVSCERREISGFIRPYEILTYKIHRPQESERGDKA